MLWRNHNFLSACFFTLAIKTAFSPQLRVWILFKGYTCMSVHTQVPSAAPVHKDLLQNFDISKQATVDAAEP